MASQLPTNEKASAGDFISNFLQQPAGAIAKSAQWAVRFGDLQGKILDSITEAYKGEPSGAWKTEKAARAIIQPQFQTQYGCFFCQAISLPGEGGTPIAEGIKANSFIRSYVGAGRNDFPIMRMSFLETNVSFAETFLRGWALATTKFGMVARSGKKNYRTDMTCFKFSQSPQGPFVTQTVHFDGVCCISVGEEEYNYDHQTSIKKRDAQFIYNTYSINAVDGIDQRLLQLDKK